MSRAPLSLRERLLAAPWWVAAALIWFASRLVSTAFLLHGASTQEANSWTGPSPSLLDYSTMWDSHWYYLITQLGYPTEVPRDADGHAGESAWAFMPVYPMVARALMGLGLSWQVASVAISLAASLVFALLLWRLCERVLPDRGSVAFAVALVLCSPVSPVLQLGYAESLHLALLAGALLAWIRGSWWLVAAIVPFMALTRPSGLAFALALGIWVLVRIVQRRERCWEALTHPRYLLLMFWATLWGFAWPLVCGIATGDWGLYVDTELAWRAAYIGRTHLVPFMAWVEGFRWWASFGLRIDETWGVVALFVLLALVALGFASKRSRSVGWELWAWCAAYVVYLLAVWFPQSSTWRILMPLFPAAVMLATVRRAWLRAAALACSVALQPVWIYFCWSVIGRDWSVP